MAQFDEQQLITKTIIGQIKIADYWCLAACGARQFISLDETKERRGGLMFRVSIEPRKHHKIIVELTWLDEYLVKLVRIKSGKATTEAEVTCYCDNLAQVVYTLCNR